MAAAGSKIRAKKRGGGLLEKRGNPGHRSRAHLLMVELIQGRRNQLGLTLKEAAGRLPAWAHINFTQWSKIELVQRDFTYQELREIWAVLKWDLESAEALVKKQLADGVIPADPRKAKK